MHIYIIISKKYYIYIYKRVKFIPPYNFFVLWHRYRRYFGYFFGFVDREVEINGVEIIKFNRATTFCTRDIRFFYKLMVGRIYFGRSNEITEKISERKVTT